MNEMRVCMESLFPIDDEIRSHWFTLPIDEEEFEQTLGVSTDSEDYRITEAELPFADEIKEDMMVGKLNDMYRTFESLPADLKEDYGELMCHFSSLDELHQHRYDIIHYAGCISMIDVAKFMLSENSAFQSLSEDCVRYFDFEAYGQFLEDNGNFLETDHGIYELP